MGKVETAEITTRTAAEIVDNAVLALDHLASIRPEWTADAQKLRAISDRLSQEARQSGYVGRRK